ncbi:MAG TPA: tetratricopeptide repeat protein, partial [Anaeromyxobacter sp.]
MSPLFAALLLTAFPADGQIGEEPAPIPTQAVPEATAPAADAPSETPPASAPAADQAGAPPPAASNPAPTPLPEATAPQVPAKPALQKKQLKILAQDSRMEAYGQFRQLYEAARFDEALPYAQRVVELSEADAERDHELPIAYNNLGATQYQLGDYPAAEASYRKSLELLESTQGISSRRLVVPLAGLGAVHAARDEHQAAAELFDRALAVSR